MPIAHDDVANAVAGAVDAALGSGVGLASISDASWQRILRDVDAMPRWEWNPSFRDDGPTPRFP
jgi:hypothetical protein